MNKIKLLQLGFGKVGKAFVKEVENYNQAYPETGIDWIDIRTSKGSMLDDQKDSRHPGFSPGSHCRSIILDLTASSETTNQLLESRRKGWPLILANKIPLVQSQAIFNELMSGPIGFRATVGAGLPVIPEIRRLIDEGHKINKIEGCLSGTMGVLFSELEDGKALSVIVQDAVKKGFTEPDPRIDLAGKDVAKKLMILARISGYNLDFSDVKCEKLYPGPMEEIDLKDFMKHLNILDSLMKSRIAKAKQNGNCIRYVASLENGVCKVGMKSVPKLSPLGQLKNDQKKILLYTNKITEPIIITGAGSGPKDTAKDLLEDLLTL